jgi:hypothetical protein
MVLYPVLIAVIAYWVYQDSQKRNMSMLWALGIAVAAIVSVRSFLIPFGFMLILYLMYQKPLRCKREDEEIVRICFRCDQKIREGERYCPNCGVDTQNPR